MGSARIPFHRAASIALLLLIWITTTVDSSVTVAEACLSSATDREGCQAVPGCAWFPQWMKRYRRRTPAIRKRKIGCRSESSCTPFWRRADCETRVKWCTWLAGKCVENSQLPRQNSTQCAGFNESAEQCTAEGGPECAWFEPRVCNNRDTKCMKVTYGCQDSETFCAFTDGHFLEKQCAFYAPRCRWNTQDLLCELTTPTSSPAPAPTLPPSTCPTYMTEEECPVDQCTWTTVQDCDNKGKRCHDVTYGCTRNVGFCEVVRGRFPKNQCRALMGQGQGCTWDGATCTYIVSTVLAPTASPTKASPFQAPTRKFTRHPNRSPSHFSTTNIPSSRPSLHLATTKPTTHPSMHPTTPLSSLPTVSPTFKPTWEPTASPTVRACTTYPTQIDCAAGGGVEKRCEWIAPRVCNPSGEKCVVASYGCQSRGFCDLSGYQYFRAQCAARGANFCNWDPVTDRCVSRCADRPPPLPTKRRMCASTVVTATDSTRHVRFAGTEPLDHAASAATSCDWNGDGYRDVIWGVPDAGPKRDPSRPGTGRVVIVLGGPNSKIKRHVAPPNSVLPLRPAADEYFVVINGTQLEAQFGYAVACFDYDGDGLDDLVVGEPYAMFENQVGRGMVFVMWGSVDVRDRAEAGAYTKLETASATDVSVLVGPEVQGSFGTSLARAGDFDKDGVHDLLVGARDVGAKRNGAGYLLYGSALRYGKVPNPIKVPRVSQVQTSTVFSSRLTIIMGSPDFSFMSTSVSGGSDANGDGFDDVALGAPWVRSDIVAGTGAAYIVFGRSGRPVLVNVGVDPGGTLTVLGKPDSVWGNLGSSVAMVGDVNVDGLQDIVLGAQLAAGTSSLDAGEAYVLFGAVDLASRGSVQVADFDGTNGFVITGAGLNDRLAFSSLEGRFDFNGDGYDDVVVGSPARTPPDGGLSMAGAAYVVYGRCTPFPAVTLVNQLNGVTGTKIFGSRLYENTGYAVASGGDIDGDGRHELLLGAPLSGRENGAGYVMFSC